MGKVHDTRATMLEAAIEVIETGGTDAIRVRDIAAAAGVSYASLYHYFGDREGLIEAAQAERYARTVRSVTAEFGERASACRTKHQFERELEGWLRRCFAPDLWSHRFDRLNVLGSAQSRPSLLALLVQAHQRREAELSAILQHASDRGWLRTEVPLGEVATWLLSLINARVFVEVDPARADSQAWDDLTVRAVLTAAVGTPGGPAAS